MKWVEIPTLYPLDVFTQAPFTLTTKAIKKMKTIKTNGKNVCIVRVDGIVKPPYLELIKKTNRQWLNYHIAGDIYSNHKKLELPPGNWRILGLSNELSEEQMKEVVEKPLHTSMEYSYDPGIEGTTKIVDCYGRDKWIQITKTYYKDYAAKQHPRSMTWLGEVDTIAESYDSWLTANKLFSENPHGETEPCISDPNPHSQYYASQLYELSRWQEAQQHVGKYLLLIED